MLREIIVTAFWVIAVPLPVIGSIIWLCTGALRPQGDDHNG